jgi:hypothetical protein
VRAHAAIGTPVAFDACNNMNVVFLSPAFPPTAPALCSALERRGVRVLGIGDEPLRPASSEARALTHYIHEPRMGEYAVLQGAFKSLTERFGAIDRVDSNGEHWLVAEAKLRDDFDIPGLRSAELARRRSKLAMAELFESAQIPYPPTVPASDASGVRRLAKRHGFPLVFKPDSGSGAVDTFSVQNEGDLAAALEREPWSKVVQPFIQGDIVTFDGLSDRTGRIVFCTSHEYDVGIMQVRRQQRDGHYWSLREIPEELEQIGRRAVAAFDIQERFFHVEFFRGADGQYTALEMNLRPPGGFTTEMMNAAGNVDVYDLWAAVMTGADLSHVDVRRSHYTAHAGRRAGRTYVHSIEELRHRLGDTLFSEHAVPPVLAATMGDMAYLLRHTELDHLKQAIALVQAA